MSDRKTYIILSSQDIYHLEKMVNGYMSDGWLPTGNVTIAFNGIYFQAMVRK